MTSAVDAVRTTSETMPAVLRRRAQETPDRVFVRVVGGRTWTFAELDALVEHWARRLQDAGVARGDRVVTLLPTGVDELALWMAAAWLGAVEVAVNPALSDELVARAVTSSRAVGVVGAAGTGERLAKVAGDGWTVEVEPADAQTLAPGDGGVAGTVRPLDAPPRRSDVATILFTSGTTGPPKGVLVPWGQVHATAEQVCPPQWWADGDVMYEPYPPFHVSGKAPICSMAERGGQVVLRESFKTGEFFADVVEHGCTIALLVGGTAQFLLDQPASSADREHPLRVVNMLPLIERVLDFEERFGVRVCGSFNMTEVSCPIVTGPDPVTGPTSAGRVREHYAAKVVDDDDREVPRGSVGELVLRADRPWTFALGYDGDPAATHAAWTNQWFHTGDLFRHEDDGTFHFVERRSDTIRRRGENVSAALLESVLVGHDEVREAVVVGVPSEVGESDIMAWIVPSGEAPDDLFETLAASVAERAAPYMVPRFWRLVDELPRTPTAKVQRSSLRVVDDRTWDRAPARQR